MVLLPVTAMAKNHRKILSEEERHEVRIFQIKQFWCMSQIPLDLIFSL
jgi:hypothetical protein